MRFIDEAVITVCAGNGGNGIVSFNRASYVPKGGPDGGNGGRGGSVILKASSQLGTLADVNLHRAVRAKNGKPGQGNKRNGRNGQDKKLNLPIGTLVFDDKTGEILADLIDEGQTIIVATGGRSGRGNACFATSTNRAPRRCEPGQKGQSRQLRLEMKLLADVGLVGRPNAGKSTLLATLTRANPRIAEYPFSTLKPALGVVSYGAYQRFIIADIPGLAEGAAEGRGLGHRFLRHIERTRLIVILIETPDPDYSQTCSNLISDLSRFSPILTGLPRLVIRSKSDLDPIDDSVNNGNESISFNHIISAVTGEGLDGLVDMIAGKLGMVREPHLISV